MFSRCIGQFNKKGGMKMFKIYHRTWWKHNKQWPNGLEPCIGKSHFIGKCYDEKTARTLCQQWNDNNESGELSDKAEYEEI